MEAYACYKEAREKIIERGSLYIPPATRVKAKKKEFREKYELDKLEAKYKKEFGLK